MEKLDQVEQVAELELQEFGVVSQDTHGVPWGCLWDGGWGAKPPCG